MRDDDGYVGPLVKKRGSNLYVRRGRRKLGVGKAKRVMIVRAWNQRITGNETVAIGQGRASAG